MSEKKWKSALTKIIEELDDAQYEKMLQYLTKIPKSLKTSKKKQEMPQTIIEHYGEEDSISIIKYIMRKIPRNDSAVQDRLRVFVDKLKAKTREANRRATKRKEVSEVAVITATKEICSSGPTLVTENQLMSVARQIGNSWRAIGRQALKIPTVKLEQIQEDNSPHVERVFAMLRHWSQIQGEEATAARLHRLLSQGEEALLPGSIDFLLQSDSESL